jgi:polyribonucleotide nucleotidyltransferase
LVPRDRIGQGYTGKIVSINAFGAFMEVLPGKDGLIHVCVSKRERQIFHP